MNINFYNIEEAQLLYYHYYIVQVSNNDLLELNGFKIRNILSVAFDVETKDFILENLFNTNGTFLTSDTKYNLFRYLSIDEISDLKNHLSNYLDYQIKSEWYSKLIQVLNTESINTIVIPTPILNHNLILTQLKALFPRKKFVDWHSYNEMSAALILDYNHAWKKKNIFIDNNSDAHAFFLKHFFENTYKWKGYNEDRHLFNRMNTQTRDCLFSNEVLTEVKDKLAALRPQASLNEWDVLHESDHKASFNPQEEIIIYFNANNSNKYRVTSSFLLMKNDKYTIKNAKDLVNNSARFEGKYDFSNLENIITQIDLGKLKKAVEKDNRVTLITQALWSEHNFNPENGRLWKQFLNRRAMEFGTENIFSKIEEASGVKQFVSLNTFENTYCNPKSPTIIPREKKVFKAICQYLELPYEYRAQEHRERNLIGGHSQELNSKLKELIKAIVEYGVLEMYKNDDELLGILNQSIEKIEKRVDMDFFGFTKDALLYACIEVCYEIIDKMRLKPIHKIEHIIPN